MHNPNDSKIPYSSSRQAEFARFLQDTEEPSKKKRATSHTVPKKPQARRRRTNTYAASSNTHRRPLHKKKKSHFTRNLLLFISFCFVCMSIFFYCFWQYLADYQKTRPDNLGKEILTAYQKYDTPTLKQYCHSLPDVLQEDSIYKKYLQNTIQTKDLFFYENLIKDNGSVITYSFCKGEQKFADLTISKTGTKSKHGFDTYEITDLTQYALSNTTITQPPGTVLLVNGTTPDASFLTDKTQIADCFSQIDAGPFYTCTYTFPDYAVAGELSASDVAGNSCTLLWDDAHTNAVISPALEDSLTAKLQAFSIEAAKEYATFATVKYAERTSLMTYLFPDTDFYKAIRTYDTDWGVTKSSDRFDKIQCTDFVQYSDTEYSCKVSLSYFVKQGKNEKEYPLAFTCYLTNKNQKLQIVNLVTETAS